MRRVPELVGHRVNGKVRQNRRAKGKRQKAKGKSLRTKGRRQQAKGKREKATHGQKSKRQKAAQPPGEGAEPPGGAGAASKPAQFPREGAACKPAQPPPWFFPGEKNYTSYLMNFAFMVKCLSFGAL